MYCSAKSLYEYLKAGKRMRAGRFDNSPDLAGVYFFYDGNTLRQYSPKTVGLNSRPMTEETVPDELIQYHGNWWYEVDENGKALDPSDAMEEDDKPVKKKAVLKPDAVIVNNWQEFLGWCGRWYPESYLRILQSTGDPKFLALQRQYIAESEEKSGEPAPFIVAPKYLFYGWCKQKDITRLEVSNMRRNDVERFNALQNEYLEEKVKKGKGKGQESPLDLEKEVSISNELHEGAFCIHDVPLTRSCNECRIGELRDLKPRTRCSACLNYTYEEGYGCHNCDHNVEENALKKDYTGELRELHRLSSEEALMFALTLMIEGQCDYMRINNLGDPEGQHNIKLARAALRKAELARMGVGNIPLKDGPAQAIDPYDHRDPFYSDGEQALLEDFNEFTKRMRAMQRSAIRKTALETIMAVSLMGIAIAIIASVFFT